MMSPSDVMMMPQVYARAMVALQRAAVARRRVDGRARAAESDEAARCSVARGCGRYARAVNVVRTRDNVALRYECDAACRRPYVTGCSAEAERRVEGRTRAGRDAACRRECARYARDVNSDTRWR